MEDSTSKLTIQLDLAKSRIRIHRKTLSALGNPEHIHLIVNPEEKTLGIIEANPTASSAHRIKYNVGKQCQELYSTSLARQLRRVMTNWVNGGKYLLSGDLKSDGTGVFPMTDAVHTATSTPKYHD